MTMLGIDALNTVLIVPIAAAALLAVCRVTSFRRA